MGAEVPELHWCEPGENAAMDVLMGSKDGFLTKRLKNYSKDRNDPSKPSGLSMTVTRETRRNPDTASML